MVQNWLYIVGTIALPFALEALLTPRPCLWLLRGALPLPRQRRPMIASFTAHAYMRAPLRAGRFETCGLATEAAWGPYVPGDVILTDYAVPAYHCDKPMNDATHDVDQASFSEGVARRDRFVPTAMEDLDHWRYPDDPRREASLVN